MDFQKVSAGFAAGSSASPDSKVMLPCAVHFYCVPDSVSMLKSGNAVYLRIYTSLHSGRNGR